MVSGTILWRLKPQIVLITAVSSCTMLQPLSSPLRKFLVQPHCLPCLATATHVRLLFHTTYFPQDLYCPSLSTDPYHLVLFIFDDFPKLWNTEHWEYDGQFMAHRPT